MENGSGRISSDSGKPAIWGYILAAVAGIAVSAFMPIAAPLIGLLLVVTGAAARKSIPWTAAFVLMAAGAGILVTVVFALLLLFRA